MKMRHVLLIVFAVAALAAQVDSQFWKNPQELLNFSWFRQPKASDRSTQAPLVESNHSTKPAKTTSARGTLSTEAKTTPVKNTKPKTRATTPVVPTTRKHTNKAPDTTPIWTTVPISTVSVTSKKTVQPSSASSAASSSSATTEAATAKVTDDSTQDVTGTTEEPRDNHRLSDFYLSKREKPQVKIAPNISQNLLPLPAGAGAALVKPTKYHYYPHNQHIYLLPECAIQQVCNAVYVRLNWTQPLCACPSRYRDPCSASLNSDDLHTTELLTDPNPKRALTLVKTCEPTSEMRICRSPRDWSLLALQNIRTGKSHYLVICRCPDVSILEGPMSHDQPTYASVPGIRVYGMMCVQGGPVRRRGRPLRLSREIVNENPPFPWHRVKALAETADWEN